MFGQGCKERTLDSFAFIYIVEGGGTIRGRDFKPRKLRAGDLLVLRPGIMHEYNPNPVTGWREIYFVFDGPVFSAWENAGLIDLIYPVVHLEPVAIWLQRFLGVIQTDIERGSVPYFIEVARMFALIADILIMTGGVLPDQNAIPWFEKACVLLRLPANKKLVPGKMAEALGISYRTFCRQFAQVTGLTPNAYRMQWLIDEACKLMLETDKKDKEIAFELGFEHLTYFYERFKKITGGSPAEFRARKRKSKMPFESISPRHILTHRKLRNLTSN
jgi:AraC-like DNA-binding protein